MSRRMQISGVTFELSRICVMPRQFDWVRFVSKGVQLKNGRIAQKVP